MATHWRFLKEYLENKVELTILQEIEGTYLSLDYINQHDFIIRYSWYQWKYHDFQSADFTQNISDNISKNILFIFADFTLFNPNKVEIVNSHFWHIRCDSDFCMQQALKAWLEKSKVSLSLPSAVDIEKFYKLKLQREERNGDIYDFLHVSSKELQKVKWVDCILEAFLREFLYSDQVRLTILTNKKEINNDVVPLYRQRFQKQNRGHQLVIIEEKINHAEVLEFYKQFDCYINASRLETFWIPVIESALLGLHVIVPNEHGMKEYVNLLDYYPVCWNYEIMPSDVRRNNNQSFWFEPDISSLRKSLRTAYEKKPVSNKCVLEKIKKKYDKNILGSRVLSKLNDCLFLV